MTQQNEQQRNRMLSLLLVKASAACWRNWPVCCVPVSMKSMLSWRKEELLSALEQPRHTVEYPQRRGATPSVRASAQRGDMVAAQRMLNQYQSDRMEAMLNQEAAQTEAPADEVKAQAWNACPRGSRSAPSCQPHDGACFILFSCHPVTRCALARDGEHLVIAPVVDEGTDQVEQHEAQIQHSASSRPMSSHQDITGRATISKPLETESMQQQCCHRVFRVWPCRPQQQPVHPDVADYGSRRWRPLRRITGPAGPCG